MPLQISADQDERAAIEAAIGRIVRNCPCDASLVKRALRGSLTINLTAVATESGVKRHRIVKLYPDLNDRIAQLAPARGTSVPLRKQLDQSRKLCQNALNDRDRSRAYSYRLLERVSQLGAQVKRLEERIAEFESGAVDPGFVVGSGQIVGVPSAAKRNGRPGNGRQLGAGVGH